MRENITRDFTGAAEKGLEVYYNENTGEFEVESEDYSYSFYDEPGEDTVKKVQNFINEQ